MLQFLKSPLGFVVTATAVVLAMSPEARKATRRLVVKGTSAMLDVVDQVRDQTSTIKEYLVPETLVGNESKHEYESDYRI